ncbi:Homeodomain-related protein [Ophiocordyceps sinensis CO18]|nr:Homeodomain-related protein [Ophiocordyceps sinensis CO18]
MPNARRGMPPQMPDQPVKKQSKWSPEEDALIIELRGSGMKWEDVSKRLPGRSAISCRLHYQNYLERRSEWDEERKNKLARLYERFKAEMWAKVAEELAVPWRAAEAMHWQLGEVDMARRAGVVPFSLAAVNVESGQRNVAPRPSTLYQPPDAVARHLTPPSPRSMYARNQPLSAMPVGPPMRGEPMAAQAPMPGPGMPPSMVPDHGDVYYTAGPGLPPIQTQGQPRNPGPLPSLAELTTGVSPYGTPVQRPPSGPLGPPGPPAKHAAMMQAAQGYPTSEPTRTKRRASQESMHREGSVRRRIT